MSEGEDHAHRRGSVNTGDSGVCSFFYFRSESKKEEAWKDRKIREKEEEGSRGDE